MFILQIIKKPTKIVKPSFYTVDVAFQRRRDAEELRQEMERRRMKERLEEERRKKREAADQAKKQNLLSPSPSLDQGLYSTHFRTFMKIIAKNWKRRHEPCLSLIFC